MMHMCHNKYNIVLSLIDQTCTCFILGIIYVKSLEFSSSVSFASLCSFDFTVCIVYSILTPFIIRGSFMGEWRDIKHINWIFRDLMNRNIRFVYLKIVSISFTWEGGSTIEIYILILKSQVWGEVSGDWFFIIMLGEVMGFHPITFWFS